MLLVFTHKITPRFSYTMKHIFTRMLGIEVKYTTKVEDFIKHTGPKITYTKQPLQNEFFVRSNDLLFEHGVNELQLTVAEWEGVPCFFRTGERSSLPFDIFSASFYLLSRYEEYLPHMKDVHGRFPPAESTAHKYDFLHLPVVDIWVGKMFSLLKKRFPELDNRKARYEFTPIIDVTTSHCYAHRGFIRSLAGLILDLGRLKFKRVAERIAVWFSPGKDPYNNYDWLVTLHKKYKVKSMFFFQFAEYSTYDKNVSPNNNRFRHLIKSVADYSAVALSASYSSFRNIDLLMAEKKRLADVINKPITSSRLRYNRVDIPQTYRCLVEAEFSNDYTMGYTHEAGFRAGTCSPYYFYDLPLELQQPIKVHPFAIHDYALITGRSEQQILERLDKLYENVKEVNGHMILIFSNELLGGQHRVKWKDLYAKVIQKYHV